MIGTLIFICFIIFAIIGVANILGPIVKGLFESFGNLLKAALTIGFIVFVLFFIQQAF